MLTLTKVHDYQKVEGKPNEVELVNENPFIRVSHGNQHLYVQNGEVWTGVGTPSIPPSNVPEWLWEAARKWSKDGRDRVGLVLPEEMSGKEIDENKMPPKMYNCPEPDCLKAVPLEEKGVHIATHNKKKKYEAIKLKKIAKDSMKKKGDNLEASVKAAEERGIKMEVIK